MKNVVYGMFVEDPENKLTMVPTDLTNDEGTWKCFYIGKSTRGLDVRMGEHETESKREYKKSGERYSSYDYLKNRMLRLIASYGLEHKDEVLCELTDGEEFEQYVKYMRAGHPVTNMKNCDRYTNFKEELEVLYREGKITTTDELQAAVKTLTHERKMREDEEYARRDKKRQMKHEKELIRQYLEIRLPDDFSNTEIELSDFITLRGYGYGVVSVRVDSEKARVIGQRLYAARNVLYPVERLQLVKPCMSWWQSEGSRFDGTRLKKRTLKELIIESVLKRFDTAEEFGVSLGFLSDVILSENNLYTGSQQKQKNKVA